MKFLMLMAAVLFVGSAFATVPPTLNLKNQYGEVSKNYVLSGNFISGLQNGTFTPSTESIIAAGALSTTLMESSVSNVTSGTYAVTLAAPAGTQDGQLKIIKAVATMTHTVTLAMTNISTSGAYTATGTTTLTFTTAGQSAVFMAIGGKWVYLGGSAVAS